MKKIIKLLTICVIVLTSSLLFIACQNNSGKGKEDALTKPENLQLSGTELEWDAIKGVDKYEVSSDGVTFVETEGRANNIDLSKLNITLNTQKLYVRAVKGTEKSELAEKEVSVEKLATPSKPVITVNEETRNTVLTWEPVANAKKYSVQVDGGTRWIKYSKTEYSSLVNGEHTIVVKCETYAKGSKIYLESDVSETSETLKVVTPSSLCNDSIHVLSWVKNDFDSFKLWVAPTGQELQEVDISSIVPEEDTYTLNIVEDNIVTKTGEYDFQLECIKDDFHSFSNILKEIGTLNINENEIYSFDNRKCNLATAKENVSINKEIKHGETGASIKIVGGAQLNLVKYGDVIPDFRLIDEISLFVYVEKPQGEESEYVPAGQLPKIIYDFPRITCSSSSDNGKTVKWNEWTKITFKTANEYENVIILATVGTNTVYVDDIYATKITTLPNGITMEEFKTASSIIAEDSFVLPYYDYSGCWWMDEMTKIHIGEEYANKTVKITADVLLQYNQNAPESIENFKVTLFAWNKERYDMAKNWQRVDKGSEYEGKGVRYGSWDNTYFSADEYKEIYYMATPDENGDIYVSMGKLSSVTVGGFRAFYKPKNIEVLDGNKVDMVAVNSSDKNTGYYGVEFFDMSNYEVGDTVKVTMQVYQSTDSDFSNLQTTGNAIWLLEKDAHIAKRYSGEWTEINFVATVKNDGTYKFVSNQIEKEFEYEGNCIYIAYNAGETSVFFYKEVNFEKIEGTPLKMKPANTLDITTGYFGVEFFDMSNYEVGDTVKVSMSVYQTTTSDYANLGASGDVAIWTTVSKLAKENSGKWVNIDFDAIVVDNTTYTFKSNQKPLTLTHEGKCIYIAYNGSATSIFLYKDVDIEYVGKKVSMQAANNQDTNTGYYGVEFFDMSDYEVGDTVKVSMKVYQTTNSDWSNLAASGSVAIWSSTSKTAKENSGKWVDIEFNAIVVDNTTYTFTSNQKPLTLTHEGKCIYLAYNAGKDSDFYYKNVTVEYVGKKVSMQAANSGDANTGYYGVEFFDMSNYEVGDTVKVSMKIYENATSDYANLSASGDVSIWTIVSKLAKENSGKWVDIEFNAIVVDNTTYTFTSNQKPLTLTHEGKCIYLALNAGKTTDFYYKEVEFEYIGKGVPKGTRHNTNATSYQHYLGLSTELAEGTEVEVSFKIKFNTNTNNYSELMVKDKSSIRWGEGKFVDGLATKYDLLTKNVTDEWTTVTCTATVYSYDELKYNNDFTLTDVSGYGNCVMLCFVNFTSADSPAIVKDISIQKIN